ncbi:MAG: Mut7-C RNAse domain-containing protein [Candidatus Tectomicrobia bacterium]|nr:Mut7-C RNAse domain-containing protein [Candidatus Tectomicrobia bacterium]
MVSLMQSECFVADAMLGKLVRWLRVMGIDVLYDPHVTDAHLLRCAEREGRVLLTRDRRLANWRGPARRFLIESAYYHEQVREVVRAFQLAGRIAVFSRCLRCNTPLRPVSRDLVAGKVPAYVFATQITFKTCNACDRLYWNGTHRDNMLRQLRAMLGDLLPTDLGRPC